MSPFLSWLGRSGFGILVFLFGVCGCFCSLWGFRFLSSFLLGALFACALVPGDAIFVAAPSLFSLLLLVAWSAVGSASVLFYFLFLFSSLFPLFSCFLLFFLSLFYLSCLSPFLLPFLCFFFFFFFFFLLYLCCSSSTFFSFFILLLISSPSPSSPLLPPLLGLG